MSDAISSGGTVRPFRASAEKSLASAASKVPILNTPSAPAPTTVTRISPEAVSATQTPQSA